MKATRLFEIVFGWLMLLAAALMPLVAVYFYRAGPEWMRGIEVAESTSGQKSGVDIAYTSATIMLILIFGGTGLNALMDTQPSAKAESDSVGKE